MKLTNAEKFKRLAYELSALGISFIAPRNNIRSMQQQLSRANDGHEYAQCAECGFLSNVLTNHIIAYHGYTSTKEYIKKYPNHDHLSKSERERLSIAIKGKNNPGWDHGGRLSPFSKKFKKYQHLSEDDADTIRYNLAKKASQTAIDNNNDNTQLSYYTSRGMSEEEARDTLSERQSTFSLTKCIEKYGEVKGRDIWKERQDKWLNSFYDRSDEEMADIIRRRISSTKTGSISKLELSVKEFFDDNGVVYDSQFAIKDNSSAYKTYLYDFKIGNIIVEVNGDYWHANPLLYTEDTILKYPFGDVRSIDIWNRDALKIDVARRDGYEVIVVWEYDIKYNRKETLNKLLLDINKNE